MALVHGRHAVTLYNGLSLTGYLNAAERSTEIENADTTPFGVADRTNIAGLAAHTFSFEGFYDPDAAPTLTAGLQVDGGVLSFCPGGGAAVGDLARLAAITATGYGETPSLDAASAISWTVTSQGYLALGYVLHPLGEDTDTTTGSSRDDAAATSTGWTAHLHVTAVDAGSWVLTIEDSSTGSSGWAVIATFASRSAAGAERLQSASATTTVKRYVRYVMTRTGGSAADGVTFFLGFARGRA